MRNLKCGVYMVKYKGENRILISHGDGEIYIDDPNGKILVKESDYKMIREL